MSIFAQQLFNGIMIGCIYALVAIGLSMIYGVLRILHIAHAVVYVVGAYGGMVGYLYTKSFILALMLAIVLAGLSGLLMERIVYRYILDKPRIVPLIASIGLLIALVDVIRLVFGPSEQAFNVPLGFDLSLMGVKLSAANNLILIVSIVALVALTYLLQKTKLGTAIKAVAQDREAAQIQGINVDQIIQLTFLISSALAGVAGVLVGVLYNSIFPNMGDVFSYKALAIVVMGGFGSVVGTALAGIFLGVSETLLLTYAALPLSREGIAMLFMIAIILWRPEGLMGRKAR